MSKWDYKSRTIVAANEDCGIGKSYSDEARFLRGCLHHAETTTGSGFTGSDIENIKKRLDEIGVANHEPL